MCVCSCVRTFVRVYEMSRYTVRTEANFVLTVKTNDSASKSSASKHASDKTNKDAKTKVTRKIGKFNILKQIFPVH